MSRVLFGVLLLLVAFGVEAQIQKLPAGIVNPTQCVATEVKSQGMTGTCWSFSATSFLESEIIKKTGKSIDLSEMFTVRNIYLEKAQKYLRYQGTCQFSQGSLAHDVFRSLDKYGAMPESAYAGKSADSIHNHVAMEKALKKFLDDAIATGHIDPHWKDGFVAILDQYMGVVPATFDYNGKTYNSKSFAATYITVKTSEYVGITSFTHHPFYNYMVVEVPDNFSDGQYFNVPLSEMMQVMNNALTQGYSIEWDGDVSELGFVPRKGYAMFSSDTAMLKTKPENCTEDAVSQDLRQAQFDDYSTMDDHLMHITGMAKSEDGKTFYIVKNSWGSKIGFEGYLLMSEAYMKMKTVSIYVNKKGVPSETLKKIALN